MAIEIVRVQNLVLQIVFQDEQLTSFRKASCIKKFKFVINRTPRSTAGLINEYRLMKTTVQKQFVVIRPLDTPVCQASGYAGKCVNHSDGRLWLLQVNDENVREQVFARNVAAGG